MPAKHPPQRLKIHANTRLAPALVTEVCKHLKKGIPVSVICDFLCIAPSLHQTWMKRGEIYATGNNEPHDHALYGQYYLAVKQAAAQYKMERIHKLHGKTLWYREMAILERVDRQNWSRHEPPGGRQEDYMPDEKYL